MKLSSLSNSPLNQEGISSSSVKQNRKSQPPTSLPAQRRCQSERTCTKKTRGIQFKPKRRFAWQRDDKIQWAHRRLTIMAIVKILSQSRYISSEPSVLQRLPHVARQLELCLYQTASSFDEYVDDSTLKPRLKVVVMKLMLRFKAKQMSRTLRESAMDRQQQIDGIADYLVWYCRGTSSAPPAKKKEA